jgi:menaquinone-9 beta-reductase
LRTILADRAPFPHDKVCGDFAGPAALAELAGPSVAETDGFRAASKIRDGAVHLDGDKLAGQPRPQVDGLPSHGRVIPGGTPTPGYYKQPGALKRRCWAAVS